MLKILSWNIEGLKCKLQNKHTQNTIKGLHVLVFQETWTTESECPNDMLLTCGYSGLSRIWKKSYKMGHPPGGVSVFIHDSVRHGIKDVSDVCFSKFIITILCDKTCFGMSHDILMFCCYLPPSGSTSYESEQNGIEVLYDCIINVTARYPDTHVMIVGDLNARTGDESDFIHDDNAAYIPGGNLYSPSDFDIPRFSSDKEVNVFGENLLEICKSLDIHIVNGRSQSDPVGQFTFISSRGASLIDYFIVSSQLFV